MPGKVRKKESSILENRTCKGSLKDNVQGSPDSMENENKSAERSLLRSQRLLAFEAVEEIEKRKENSKAEAETSSVKKLAGKYGKSRFQRKYEDGSKVAECSGAGKEAILQGESAGEQSYGKSLRKRSGISTSSSDEKRRRRSGACARWMRQDLSSERRSLLG